MRIVMTHAARQLPAWLIFDVRQNMKTPRDFSARPAREQQWLTDDSWCDVCNQADLGMREPKEFEEDGKIVVEGLCRKCGSPIRNYVEITQSEPPRADEKKA
jgi:hypothetical protein